MDPRAPWVIVHYCFRFVVVEVNGKTPSWPVVTVTSLLPDMVAAVLSCFLHLTVAQVAELGERFRAVTLEFPIKDWFLC